MKKKIFVSLLATLMLSSVYLCACPAVCESSADRISNERERRRDPAIEAFRQGLRELGYVEGKMSWSITGMLKGDLSHCRSWLKN